MKRLLEGKHAIVTGASKGIGKGIAKTFLDHGATVVITGRTEKDLKAAVEELSAHGPISYIVADVSKADEIKTMISTFIERHGRLDVLCSNAGIFPMSLIENMSEEEWDYINTVNVKGMFLAVKECIPLMKKQGGGNIVITSSITGPITGFTGWSHYGATKAAQLGFMRSAAIELARYGIRINAVQPGNIATEGLLSMGEDYANTMKKSIPLGTLGEPEDIGNAMAFLASDLAKFITGQTIVVDGGQILPESSDAMEVPIEG
ncbi:MAG: 3-oxoacyl-ACP reductase FabG [Aminobacterium sp.]|uniref:3-oxoacyl-ACP reductase FabG n=1 Tax=Aminobacterium sp. TaxID=1872491 RepID=UPI001BCF481D|nr:3-oxoacyl-ACP reductase FabG [Aminobacterium sp.]MDD2206098.1 3-oxoacyl-ACP reductase FabG [Aminobacterium sp.]MDD3426756.1 3-oxoacyl-ACP reductase FabG [Aminobacterium sp.]MDD3707817.1 3-oxoacyl-ACP reductase FabG [Aminobacterium sp.]MDD4228058.1 3-oxoacyl-ACP reductase FabG [Aminobacterium sp.]MDD4551095.1 3-oxoacyl-ACP reductase FabG [Aminobacterium sp.]